jgi:hypothetical protein
MRASVILLVSVCVSLLLGAVQQLPDAAAAATGDWDVELFETTKPAVQSMASGGTDNACIAYRDQATSCLKCARWTGTDWERTVVDTDGIILVRTSVAVGSDGNPRIAYAVQVLDLYFFQVRYASYSGSAWTHMTVADMGLVAPAGAVSIAVDGNDMPAIAYADPATGALMYAKYNGVKWTITKVDDLRPVRVCIAIGPGDVPCMSAFDYSKDALLYFKLDGGIWKRETVESGEEAGLHHSMALDRDGHPRIAFTQGPEFKLKYAEWTGAVWDVSVIDSDRYVGSGASLVLDRWDRAHISYAAQYTYQIRYATWKGNQWVKELVDSSYVPNYGTSICLNASGFPRMCYDNWTAGELRLAVHVPDQAPTTPSRPAGPALGMPGASYSYTTHATDADDDTIEYVYEWGDGTSTTSKGLTSGETVTLPHVWASSGSFQVRAMARDEYGAVSGWSAPFAILIDNLPNVPAVPAGPAAGAVGGDLTFTTSAIDPDGNDVKYVFEMVADLGPPPVMRTSETPMVPSGGNGNATWRWDSPGNYSIRAKAVDAFGLESIWSAERTFVVSTPPAAPGRPTGPAKCQQGAEASFGASATDPDGDRVRYEFDWNASGAGTTTLTDLVASGTAATATHSWARWGTYPVKVRAVDEHGIASGWSDPLEVAVNAPPGAPVAPTAPAKAEAGKAVGLTASAVDPDGDMVKLVFDWGEGGNATAETGFFPSGTPTNLSHTWKKAGTYKVRVKAVDADGSASDWSAPVDVVVKAKGKGTPGPSAAAAMAALAAAATVAAAASRNKTRGRR